MSLTAEYDDGHFALTEVFAKKFHFSLRISIWRKNQHYVPKFYLRNFSINENQKQIRLFNKKSERFVGAAPIKNEGSSNFYYGKDGKIEKQLSVLEGYLANIVKQILSTLERPKYQSKEHIHLLTFVISTELRNPVRSNIYVKTTEAAIKKLISIDLEFKNHPQINEILDSVEIIPRDAKTYSLTYINNIVETTLDLHIKLLVNNTAIPFITSDNPVIKYNQFLETKSNFNSITGFGLQGLQIFVPLTEKVMALFYDEQMYYVGSRRQKNVIIDRKDDIDNINLLQMANCYSNVYGGDQFTEALAKILCEKAKKLPEFNKVHHHSSPSTSKNGEVITQTVDSVRIKLQPSFISLSTYAYRMKIDESLLYVRQHSLITGEIHSRERQEKARERERHKNKK